MTDSRKIKECYISHKSPLLDLLVHPRTWNHGQYLIFSMRLRMPFDHSLWCLVAVESAPRLLSVVALGRRAEQAGIDGFHPHRLRHTDAHRWLAKGGSEAGLMAIAGWSRTDMLIRYTRARASERAADESRRLDLGAL